MSAECPTCAEERCAVTHCENCLSEATTQCDRAHDTCEDCAWWVGEGPDSSRRCAGCDVEDQERQDELADDLRRGER